MYGLSVNFFMDSCIHNFNIPYLSSDLSVASYLAILLLYGD